MDSEMCMKCGRERKSGQVFCDACLAEMEKYPVKPGVVVLLPNRQNGAPKAAQRRKHPIVSPEEQILRLKQRVKRLTVSLILVIALVLAAGWFVVTQYLDHQEGKLLPGQNYSSEQTQESGNNP